MFKQRTEEHIQTTSITRFISLHFNYGLVIEMSRTDQCPLLTSFEIQVEGLLNKGHITSNLTKTSHLAIE